MDPVMLVLVPGFLGGLVVALIVFRMRAPGTSVDSRRDLPLSTDVINMARIRVEGVGGLGLVAMALTVAWFVLRIRQSIALGLGLGVLLAVVLILVRRRGGPMPSSAKTPGATATLSLDAPTRPRDTEGHGPPSARTQSIPA